MAHSGSAPDNAKVSDSSVPVWAPYALIALLTAAALDVTGRIGQIGPARFTAYQLLALGMAALAVWLLLTRRVAWPKAPVSVPVLVFLGTAAFSLVFATERLSGIVQLASLGSSMVLALIVMVLVRTPRAGALAVGGLLLVAGVLGVFALLEWADAFALQHPVFYTPGYGIRARVTFGDPNIFASFLMAVLLLAVPVLLKARMGRIARACGWVASAFALAGLTTTFSRGGLGGLIVGLTCIVLLVRASRKAKFAFVALVLVAMLAVGMFVFDPGWIADNVIGLSDDGSTMNRIYMAKGALDMWLAHPFGVGIDNYPVIYPQYQDPRAEPGIIESHTAYITVLAETGFLGLLAFLWTLWAFFARTARPASKAIDPTLHALAVGSFAASAGLCAQAFTYSLEGSKFLWFAIGLGGAAWLMYAERESAVT